jgi:hypothetical protein
MRECENIQSWISLSGDLAFCHQHGIYGFKFPSNVFVDLFLRSHYFFSSFHKLKGLRQLSFILMLGIPTLGIAYAMSSSSKQSDILTRVTPQPTNSSPASPSLATQIWMIVE